MELQFLASSVDDIWQVSNDSTQWMTLIEPELLKRLRCMQTGSMLTAASAELLDRVNSAIENGKLRDRLGRSVDTIMQAGLVNDDVSEFYPIVDGVVQMLRDESIDLQQLAG